MSRLAVGVVLVAATACSGTRTRAPSGVVDPRKARAPQPDYTEACTPSGLDTSATCLGVTLAAIDAARRREHLGPMALPSNFARLGVPEQLLVVIDRERVDRGLPPMVGLDDGLGRVAQHSADVADTPPDPGPPYTSVDSEWIGSFINGLDIDYQWLYDDDKGWPDRHIVLDNFPGNGVPVLGAALNPTADRGAASLAVTMAVVSPAPAPTSLSFTWDQAQALIAAGPLRPLPSPPSDESTTHIKDPSHTVPADPDFTATCTADIDNRPGCLGAVLAAVNHARAQENVKPMRLPNGFADLTVPQQVLIAINLERVDRGLPPFKGLTAELNRVSQRGADTANDPPDPGDRYDVSDGEWAGGSANGLDAVYGWMYDDGIGSGNLDCPPKGGRGCWGHRHGVLDDFGSVGTLVMGAAINPTGDKTSGDRGGTSIAATLAVTRDPGPLVYAGG